MGKMKKQEKNIDKTAPQQYYYIKAEKLPENDTKGDSTMKKMAASGVPASGSK